MVEVEGLSLVFISYDILALRRAELVIVHFVIFVRVAEFLAGFGTSVGAVIEAVVFPRRIGEFGPFDMVGQEFFRCGVHYVDFGPVRAGARNGICGVLAVLAHENAGESHGAVIAQSVGVEEYLTFAVGSGGTVDDSLIVAAVVGRPVVVAVLAFPGSAAACETVERVETCVYFVAERNLREIVFGDFVLGLHPCQRGGSGVVFERTVGVGDNGTEYLVGGGVGRSLGIGDFCLMTRAGA